MRGNCPDRFVAVAPLGILCALLCLLPRQVRAEVPARPKTLLLLASGLSYDHLRPDGPLPHVRQLAEAGGLALLNTTVAGPATDAAAFLSAGAGERMAVPDVAIAAQVYAPEARTPEEDTARAVYRRRFGRWPPPDVAILHLGLPALQRAQRSPRRAAQIGALGETLRSAGLRTAALGDWRSVLVLMDRNGTVQQSLLADAVAPAQVTQALRQADIVAVTTPHPHVLDRVAQSALPRARSGQMRVIVAVPAPPRDANRRWARLGFLAASGPGIPARSLLVSPTTRTPGLVANVDIAPALAAWYDLRGTFSGAGRAIAATASPAPWSTIAQLDRQVVATRNATVPVLVGYGTFAIGTGLVALLALLLGNAACVRAGRFGLLMAAAALLAFLPAGAWAPRNAGAYGLAVAAISALLAGAATILARRLVGSPRDISPLGLLLTGAALLVALDAFLGSPLVSRSLLSGYFLPGIRFYGIGNEYMGLAIGAALAGPLLIADGSGASSLTDRKGAFPTLLLWLALLLAIGAPFWGANAGGGLTATMTFLTAVFALRSRRLRARQVMAAFGAALAVTLLFALMDRARPELARSHVGAAVAAGQVRGPQALAEIALGKAGMNLRLLLTAGAFGALAGLVPIWWLISRGPLGRQAAQALERRPRLRRAVPAAAWGALVALLFNDSGIVAALLLLAPPTGAVIEGMLCDSLP